MSNLDVTDNLNFKSLSEQALLTLCDILYPIGALYITTSNADFTNFLGAHWQKVTGDAYLKIVESNADNFGGTSSNHIIPNTCLPSHRHRLQGAGRSKDSYCYAIGNDAAVIGGLPKNNTSSTWTDGNGGYTSCNTWVQNTGGGEVGPSSEHEVKAYKPYYYGVYVWKRIG